MANENLSRRKVLGLFGASGLTLLACSIDAAIAVLTQNPTATPIPTSSNEQLAIEVARRKGITVDEARRLLENPPATPTLNPTSGPTTVQASPTLGTTQAPPTPGATAIATAKPSPIVETIYTQAETRRREWEMIWPKTPQETAVRFGGNQSQWILNSDWFGKTINGRYDSYKVDNYEVYEWRPVDSNNLPFKWPRSPQEALAHFFPGVSIDPRFIQAKWTDPKTGLVGGWHLSEDHWLFSGGPVDLTLNLHAGEVAEGYTVQSSENHELFRSWIVFGGFKQSTAANQGPVKITQILMQKGQGMTIWIPGTDPNKIGLEMEAFNQAKTPYYRGPNGIQLGPDSYGFSPVYPAANLVNK